ncbi:di-trans,poly-cis-decaprenylcistransferase [Candidatus Bathyarchaeota archaeon]|nr:di-trans,poly-cis-decaprenylcistransferase [Candidatus Bathyarchaeota archaeon]
MLTSLTRFMLRPVYRVYESYLEREVKKGEIPSHIAVILDGNRRFARKMGFSELTVGHQVGAEKVREFLLWCLDLKIKNLTLFAFSTENFYRPRGEVEKLMELAERKLYEFAEDELVHRNRVKIKVIGRLNMLPKKVLKAIEKAEEATKNYDSYLLNVALAYGGRAEIVDAIKEIMRKVKAGKVKPEEITESMITQHLYTGGLEPPQMVIRTSGEKRLSNFLIWQSCDSYLCFIDVYWPEIRRIDLLRGIRTYQRRKRILQKKQGMEA